jgi:hypothetical protein
MTAIFATWNKWGFSLAADSNLTNQSKGVAWVDPIEKIIRIPNHQVAFAASGAAMLENVEINELIREWSKSLENQPLSSLREYVENFLIFYSRQHFYRKESLPEWAIEIVGSELKKLKEIIDEKELTIKELESEFVAGKSGTFPSFNIYSSFFEKLHDFNAAKIELSDVDDWRIDQFRRILSAVEERGEQESLLQQNYFQYENLDWYRNMFNELFNTEFSIENDLHLKIMELSLVELESRLWNPENKVKTLFIGFGQKDWQPQAIEVHLYNFGCGLPSAAIKRISNPNYDWFLSIAIERGVFGFLRGVGEGEQIQNLIKSAKPLIKKGKIEDFSSLLTEYGESLLTAGMEKMDSLTPARLEYIARLFIQIESLYSYLNEPVPSVGGDVATITMTKTTVRENRTPELI